MDEAAFLSEPKTYKTMRVLLVDDHRELAEYVRRELEEESLNVVVAHDGASALRLAETSAFDIIVLDVMMPFMDGLQVTRSLRGQTILTPILLLAARDAREEIVRGLEAGADDYLTKPFSFDVLLARIRARTRRFDQKNAQLRFSDLKARCRRTQSVARKAGLDGELMAQSDGLARHHVSTQPPPDPGAGMLFRSAGPRRFPVRMATQRIYVDGQALIRGPIFGKYLY